MDNEMSVSALIAIIGAGLTLLVASFALRLIYGYRITNGAIEVVLFHALPIYRISFANIENVQILSWKQPRLGLTTLRFGNRFARRYVFITKRGGWFGHVAISPADVDNFVSQISLGRAND
jgi:hypothetical protein